ncbi:MAG: polysaccharide biosynthesis C-terminal domain-containing protein [Solirubrobacterales bacterium]|nr:polysaccharide biosynthesis C-terminal domain-containing protein [Solirubrobacterales bacterium]
MLQSRDALQAAFFTATAIGGSLLNGITLVLLAHLMSVVAFGSYSFAQTFLQIGGMLFEFGLFLPVARLATKEVSARREIIGAALALYVPVAVGFALAVFGSSLLVDSVFSVHAGLALRVSAGFAVVYPFTTIAVFLCQGADRLHLYSASVPVGSGLLAIVLGVLIALGAHLSPPVALVIASGSMLLGYLPVAILIRPVFRNLRTHMRSFVEQARTYGFGVYVGRVLAIGTYQMDILMLGGFADAKTVGLYVLAGAIASTIATPSVGLGNALFGRMVTSNEIPRRWLLSSCAISVVGVTATWALTGPFLAVLFPRSYADASAYVIPLAIAAALRGPTSVFNSFLSAQGRGRELRNAASVLTVSNLVLNLGLIPPFGATGAAWASAVALFANLVAHVHYYKRSRTSALA